MSERKFNTEMRIDRMISFYEALIASCCAPLPDDWLQMDFVRIQNPAIMPIPPIPPAVPQMVPTASCDDGYSPIRYKARDEFFALYGSRRHWTKGFYTIEGRQLFFGGFPDNVNGRICKIAYYAEVPALAETGDSWVYEKYPDLYLTAALSFAALHAVGEEQTAANFKALTEDTINKLNVVHLRAKASGSRVTRSRMRTFG